MSEPDHIEEDLQDLYENAPCGYLSLRTDGRIAKANQTFCRWTGYAPDELIGKRLHDFLNIAGRIFYETHFAPLLRMQGFFNEVALDLVKKDGEPFPVLVNAAERTDAEGKPQFIRLTVFNATDRRRYERELLKARDELKALAATLEQRVAEETAERLQQRHRTDLPARGGRAARTVHCRARARPAQPACLHLRRDAADPEIKARRAGARRSSS